MNQKKTTKFVKPISTDELAILSERCKNRAQRFFSKMISDEALAYANRHGVSIEIKQIADIHGFVCANLAANSIATFQKLLRDDGFAVGMFNGIVLTIKQMANDYHDGLTLQQKGKN